MLSTSRLHCRHRRSVFNAQAGATVGYSVLWAVPVGVLGIIVLAEMSGRIAAIAKKPNFVLVRERYSERLATFTLVGSLGVSVSFSVLIGFLLVAAWAST